MRAVSLYAGVALLGTTVAFSSASGDSYSSGSDDYGPVAEAYAGAKRLSPYYDINPWAYDSAPMTAADVGAWKVFEARLLDCTPEDVPAENEWQIPFATLEATEQREVLGLVGEWITGRTPAVPEKTRPLVQDMVAAIESALPRERDRVLNAPRSGLLSFFSVAPERIPALITAAKHLSEEQFSALLQSVSAYVQGTADLPSEQPEAGWAEALKQALPAGAVSQFSALMALPVLARNLCICGYAKPADVTSVNTPEAVQEYLRKAWYGDLHRVRSLIDGPRWASRDFSERFSDGKRPPDGELHVFAFNVGQGNCIILRVGAKSVIVDAGRGAGLDQEAFQHFIFPKIRAVLQGTTLQAIFISHPHEDHYSLVRRLTLVAPMAANCKVFLGGTKAAWMETQSATDFYNWATTPGRKVALVNSEITEYAPVAKTTVAPNSYEELLPNTSFEFLLPWEYGSKATGNACSFLLKVRHNKNNDCSFLFTGDAEGGNLEAVTGHAHSDEHLDLLRRAVVPEFRHLLPAQKQGAADGAETRSKANRKALRSVAVVFAAHHGTETHASQNLITHLLGGAHPPMMVVISSTVTIKDGNPAASTIRLVPKSLPPHPKHAVAFNKKDFKDYKFTTRPVYSTEAAPGGAYWIKSDGEKVCLYNAYPQECLVVGGSREDIGFFQVSPAVLPSPTEALGAASIKRPRRGGSPTEDNHRG